MASWAELNQSAGGQGGSSTPSASKGGGWAAANASAVAALGSPRSPNDARTAQQAIEQRAQATLPNGAPFITGSTISATPPSNKKFQLLGVTINRPTSLYGTESGNPIIQVDPNKFEAKASEDAGFLRKMAAAGINAVSHAVLGVSQALGNAFDVMLIDTEAKREQAAGIDSSKSTLPELRQRVEQGKPAIPTTSEKVGAGLNIATSLANVAFTPVSAQLSVAEELPVIGKPIFGTINKGFELLDFASRFVGTNIVNVLPVDDKSKEVLRAPIEDLAGIVGTLFGVKAIHTIGAKGGGRVVDALPVSEGTKGQIRGGVQLGAGVALEPFSVAYRGIVGGIKAKTEARQAAGEEITPEVAQRIVNETVKEVKAPEVQAIMEVPTAGGEKTRVYTSQKLVLENLIKGREDLNYKLVSDLGIELKTNEPITSRFEWDYAKQQGTIYTTNKTTAVDLAHELGHYVDRQLGAGLSIRLSEVLPDYHTNREQINQMLADYALDRLGGNAKHTEVNAEILKIAENIRDEIKSNADQEARQKPAKEFAAAVGDVINDPLKREKSPELAQLIDFSLKNDVMRKGNADVTGVPGSKAEMESVLKGLTKAQREAIKNTRTEDQTFYEQRLKEQMAREAVSQAGEAASTGMNWKKVANALRDSAEFKKEATLTDRTIDGVLMERNGKFRVVSFADVKKMQKNGWESGFTMDEIAHANGFENAEIYVDYIMGLDSQLRGIGTSSEQRAAHEYLLKNDPNYAKLTETIDTLREQLTSAEDVVRAETKGSAENTGQVPTEQKAEVKPLESSAKNYTSVDAFIKDQEVFYHGTNKNFNQFKLLDESQQLATEARAIYLAPKKSVAEYYARGENAKVIEAFVDTGKILDFRNKKQINEIVDRISDKQISDTWNVGENGFTIAEYRDFIRNGEYDYVQNPTVQKVIREMGYEGFYQNDYNGLTLAIYDPANVKTKAELTEIWNKAQGETAQKAGNTEVKSTKDVFDKAKNAEVKTSEPKPSEVTQTVKTGTSKVGKSIARKVIEQKLEDSYRDVAGYEKINIKDQARRVEELLNNDLEQAKRIMTGEEAVPDGMRASAFIIGMEEYALKTGNADLAFELANSPLVSETSIHAQEMRLLAERSPDSAVARLREVKRAREKAAEKALQQGETLNSAIKKTRNELNEAIKKTRPKKEDWNSFIESIKC